MKISLFNVGGACCLLRIDDTLTIGIDPFLSPAGTVTKGRFMTSERVKDPSYVEKDWKAVDLWLITHGHFDHLDDEGMACIPRDVPVIIEPRLKKRFTGFTSVTPLAHKKSESMRIKDYKVTVTAVPAYHGSSRLTLAVAGPVNGYLITIEKAGDRRIVYFTSDTVYREELLQALQGIAVDVMIANMGEVLKGKPGGPLTLSLEMLKKLNAELKPAVTVPIHNDDYSHYFPVENQAFIDCGFRVIETGTWAVL
ncbi:MAG: MBL fold metallo-hydrolase [Spirochaetales bacterium]|nr:MBL fold metallo-hydrolase [Spirochaetales bacterium]